jgi:hypothetical protein
MPDLKPESCPKYPSCSCPICPLAPRWPTAVHLHGEKVCPYLLATGKAGVEQHYAGDPVYEACRVQLPLIVAKYSNIRTRVAAAARQGFRSDNLRRTTRSGGKDAGAGEESSGAA